VRSRYVGNRDQREITLSTYIDKVNQKGTAPIIVNVLHSRLKTLFGMAADPITVNAANPTDAKAREATEKQDEIGWDNFIRGRHSILWNEAQAEYLAGQGEQTEIGRARRKKKSEKWIRDILEATLNLLTTVWIDRNEIIHRATEANPAAKVAFIHDRVETMYSRIDSFCQRDRARIFGKSLEDLTRSAVHNHQVAGNGGYSTSGKSGWNSATKFTQVL